MPRKYSPLSPLLLLSVTLPAAGQSPSAAPAGTPSAAPAAAFGQGVYIYPKIGQSEQQLWSDRYACDNWSRSQSGFDPSRPDGGVPAEEADGRRQKYRHAMTACLEARGYTVAGTPSAPAPAPAVPSASAPVAVPPAAPAAAPLPKAAYASSAPVLRYRPLTVHISAGYSLTEGALKSTLDDGGNISLGLTWFPTSWLPFGLRIDGSYSEFSETRASLNAEATALGTNVDFGHQALYGGDADVQFDLAHRSTREKMYLFGGFGWYRQSTVFRQQQNLGPGFFCDYFGCGYGFIEGDATVATNTSAWTRSWNAGFGAEFALSDPVSLFVEARYLRLAPYNVTNAYIPINIGLRF